MKCGLWPKGAESGRPKLPTALLQLKLVTGRLGSSAFDGLSLDGLRRTLGELTFEELLQLKWIV